MDTFEVHGSHGIVSVSTETGEVVEVIADCDCDSCRNGNEYTSYSKYRYDVKEWMETYSDETLAGNHIDILDLGYWLPDGRYAEPEYDWREEVKIMRAGGELTDDTRSL
jgi:hypothetical protein